MSAASRSRITCVGATRSISCLKRLIAALRAHRTQATAMSRGAAGRADQRSEPGRIDEGDPIQVHDQRLAVRGQLEQALP